MNSRNKSIYRSLILLIVLWMQVACDFELFALNVERAEQEATQTAMQMTSQASSQLETLSPPESLVLPESTPLPESLPKIVLNYSAIDMMDLPVIRATLETPISVVNQGAMPFVARMQAEQTQTMETPEYPQPGVIRQLTTFEGEYDPITGKLTGTLSHQYFIDKPEYGEHYAHKVTYNLTCTVDAQRLENSNIIEGTCVGQSSFEEVNPGHDNTLHTENKTVFYSVSGTISDDLVKVP